ncbi:MAG: tripartite tricarboxylate transporter TctB family protein [Reyranellaceae bacterium]
MHRLAATDLWAGLLCMAMGGAALLLLADTRMGTVAAMGPGFLPTWLARILVGIGALIALRSAAAARLTPDWRRLRPLLLILGGVVFFALALRPLGFALTSFVLLLLAAAAGRDFRWREALLAATGVSAAASALFIVALKLNLPLFPS